MPNPPHDPHGKDESPGPPESAERAALKFLRKSKADADAGRTVPAREFLESLGKKKPPKCP